MLMGRDKEILAYFEKYYYGTIKIIEKIYFKQQNNSYNICRRRLTKLVEYGYLRTVKNKELNINVYIYNYGDKKSSTPTLHRLLLLNILAELNASDFDVIAFDVEKEWIDRKIRSDGFTQFGIARGSEYIKFNYFIEVQLSNNPPNLEKYNILYESKEAHKLCNGHFPRILYVSDREYTGRDQLLPQIEVIQLNTDLDTFLKIIL